MGTNVLFEEKRFDCSCHATWLPCKTSIDQMHKWRPKNSFVYVLIRLTSLVCMKEFLKKCFWRVRLVSLTSTSKKTAVYAFGLLESLAFFFVIFRLAQPALLRGKSSFRAFNTTQLITLCFCVTFTTGNPVYDPGGSTLDNN